ncbi:MAG: SAM hydrolase/SAM-dependent halogenase family protein [Geminicoccaceae bacterium]
MLKWGRTFCYAAMLICGLGLTLFALIGKASAAEPTGVIVYQSDFGLKDGAVSAMRGVAYSVDPTLRLENLTHEIPAFNIWEGAYRLNTTAPYWPPGTVFVSVVDPGVGTDRKSVVLMTTSGHYFVTPDNGTLTLVSESLGIEEVREIDEATNRLEGSEQSYTFHGRDVYSYTAARLASGQIRFEEVGGALPLEVTSLDYQQPDFTGDSLVGTIPVLDIQFGNVWTNIDRETFEEMNVDKGETLAVVILENDQVMFEGKIPYVSTFGDVPEGDELAYLNSVNNLSFAINWGNFADTHGISSGAEWRVEVTRP